MESGALTQGGLCLWSLPGMAPSSCKEPESWALGECVGPSHTATYLGEHQAVVLEEGDYGRSSLLWLQSWAGNTRGSNCSIRRLQTIFNKTQVLYLLEVQFESHFKWTPICPVTFTSRMSFYQKSSWVWWGSGNGGCPFELPLEGRSTGNKLFAPGLLGSRSKSSTRRAGVGLKLFVNPGYTLEHSFRAFEIDKPLVPP